MTPEGKLFSKIKPKLSTWGAYDRVENSAGVGMADVFYNIEGKVGWIETKIIKSNKLYFEKFQPNWMKKHTRQGFKRLFVICSDNHGTILVYRYSDINKAPKEAKGKWIVVDITDLPKPELILTKPYKEWDRLKEILIL